MKMKVWVDEDSAPWEKTYLYSIMPLDPRFSGFLQAGMEQTLRDLLQGVVSDTPHFPDLSPPPRHITVFVRKSAYELATPLTTDWYLLQSKMASNIGIQHKQQFNKESSTTSSSNGLLRVIRILSRRFLALDKPSTNSIFTISEALSSAINQDSGSCGGIVSSCSQCERSGGPS